MADRIATLHLTTPTLAVALTTNTIDLSDISGNILTNRTFSQRASSGQGLGVVDGPVNGPPEFAAGYALGADVLARFELGTLPPDPNTPTTNPFLIANDDYFGLSQGINFLDTVGFNLYNLPNTLPASGLTTAAFPAMVHPEGTDFLDFGNGPLVSALDCQAASRSNDIGVGAIFWSKLGWDSTVSPHPDYNNTLWAFRVTNTAVDGVRVFLTDAPVVGSDIGFIDVTAVCRVGSVHWIYLVDLDAMSMMRQSLVEWNELGFVGGFLNLTNSGTRYTPVLEDLDTSQYLWNGCKAGFIGTPLEVTADRRPVLVSPDWVTYQFLVLSANDADAQDAIDRLNAPGGTFFHSMQGDDLGIFYLAEDERAEGPNYQYSAAGALPEPDPPPEPEPPPPPQFSPGIQQGLDPFVAPLLRLIPSPYPPPMA